MSKLKDLISITRKEYYELKKAELELELLNQGGVDNWEWHGESLHKDNQFQKGLKQFRNEIFGSETIEGLEDLDEED